MSVAEVIMERLSFSLSIRDFDRLQAAAGRDANLADDLVRAGLLSRRGDRLSFGQAKSLVDTCSTDNLIDGACIRLRFDRLIRRATADDRSGSVTLWTRHGDSLRRSVTNALHLETNHDVGCSP